jgi:spermidine synthase
MSVTSREAKKVELYALCSIGMISCSMLTYEVLLTRICALRLFFHFGFLIVSNCLLGIGASGSIIAVLQDIFARRVRFWIWVAVSFYLVSLIAAYAFLITYSIDPGITLSSIGGLLDFSFFNVVAAIPFFFAGSAIGLILTFNAEQVNKVYCVDLIGAGIGCLLCPLLLWQAGAGGCFAFLAVLAAVVMMISAPARYRFAGLIIGGVCVVGGLVLLPVLDNKFPVPCKTTLHLTEKKEIFFQGNFPYSRWSTNSRVDLVDVDRDKRFMFGIGAANFEKTKALIPEQKFILQDGSAGTYIVNFSEHPEALDLIRKTAYSIAPMLKHGDNPRVFIIGVGGASDVWAAKAYGASYIKGIELNKQILDIHRGVLNNYSTGIINDPAIELIHDEGRSALIRDAGKYDIIQMSGIDTWTSLTSGAYVLAENYLYTVEAIQTMYDRLADGGILSISRFAKDMEALRILSTISEALHDRPAPRFDKSVVCIDSGVFMLTTLLKKGEFTRNELERLEQFAADNGFMITYHPAKTSSNILEQFVRSDNKKQFIKNFQRDISPTTDDRPYFFNFTRWNKLLSARQYLQESTAVSQGNPLFIFGQLLVSGILAFAFILLPIIIFKRRQVTRRYLGRFLIYFSCLGLGFISIEIAIMQKLVLFLGHPLYSITVTLFSMLVFTGIGSFYSERWFREASGKAWIVPVLVLLLLGLFIYLSPAMVHAWIMLPTIGRILITVAILAPISFVLGIPFAYGIRLVNRFNPSAVPWAWAVNGGMTVVGSITTVIFSMNFGFSFVLVLAIVIYFIAFLSVGRLVKKR